MLTNIKLDFIEPVIVRGYPKEEDFSLLEKLADEIIEKHRELGIARPKNHTGEKLWFLRTFERR